MRGLGGVGGGTLVGIRAGEGLLRPLATDRNGSIPAVRLRGQRVAALGALLPLLAPATERRWVLKFGPLFARELRRRPSYPTSQWHLDEIAVMISGKQFWLWRAVDSEGEVLDLLVQRRRNKAAAIKLMRKLL